MTNPRGDCPPSASPWVDNHPADGHSAMTSSCQKKRQGIIFNMVNRSPLLEGKNRLDL